MCILKINKLNFDFRWTNTSINVFKIILWWFGSVLKCIPISTPPPPIRAHLPHSLPVSQQMLIGVTRLHSQLYCISLIICAGMTHIHTHTHTRTGFPLLPRGWNASVLVCEGQCGFSVCVCLLMNPGVYWSGQSPCSRIPSKWVRQAVGPPLCPLSAGLPRELGPGASLISTTLFHDHLSLSPRAIKQFTDKREGQELQDRTRRGGLEDEYISVDIYFAI